MDPTQRFTGRVTDYAKTRPSYPEGVLAVLASACGLGASSVVADLGSGTGLFTQRLLESGATVYAVEPNDEMRRAAEQALGSSRGFRSVAGRAEATTLDDASVDVVTAAQAFHWFDLEPARAEMKRILRAPGRVALVWNDRDLVSTAFLRDYEALLVARCPKYQELQGKADATAKFDALLGAGAWSRHVVPNAQRLDREGLASRLLSSSYMPREGEPGHDEILAELGAIFDRHAQAGEVAMLYATVIIAGSPA
ncbi:MAG: class I SAM-dependent methyltransferase [Labilithrix sp.]|nr:class I SAM-dependent methyltransferase [Labilithrix sp.]